MHDLKQTPCVTARLQLHDALRNAQHPFDASRDGRPPSAGRRDPWIGRSPGGRAGAAGQPLEGEVVKLLERLKQDLVEHVVHLLGVTRATTRERHNVVCLIIQSRNFASLQWEC